MEIPSTLSTIPGIVLLALGILALACSTLAFVNRIGWGRARRMGVPAIIFTWMTFIYWLVLFKGVYGLASVILELPIWTNIALYLLVFVLSMAIYTILRRREKFRREIFLVMFLVPLSIPGVHVAAKYVPKALLFLSP